MKKHQYLLLLPNQKYFLLEKDQAWLFTFQWKQTAAAIPQVAPRKKKKCLHFSQKHWDVLNETVMISWLLWPLQLHRSLKTAILL